MDELNEKYNEVVERKEVLSNELDKLKNDSSVQRYLNLSEEFNALQKTQKDLYERLRVKGFKNCNHIIVYSKVEHDYIEGRTYYYCGCIKCGLNEAIFDSNKIWLSYDEKLIYDYMHNNHIVRINGRKTNAFCDIELAKAIYKKIKEYYPDIDDETVIKYFNASLHNIRKTNVSETRKENRAKRLDLNPRFNKWRK